ncbi:MAG: hypothetical protein KBB94_06440 [Legionellaceae bacterium]|nr:hypothetical protein [Legionellaceae bacterium]MBP9775777.1 hypothetical protein [Legionellaceae bacterium]
MYKIFMSLILLFTNVLPACALSADSLPLSFQIKEQKCQGRCFYLTAQEGRMGSLLPAPMKMGTYEFFDAKNQLQVTLRLTGAYWTALMFDIYDKNRTLVAKLRVFVNYKSKQWQRFELYAPDEKTILAIGVSNLFGTHHTVYMGKTWHILAEFTRPLFTWSRDSEVNIMDSAKLASMMDPNVFAAVLALDCIHDVDIAVDAPDVESTPVKKVQTLQEKLKNVAKKSGLPEGAPEMTQEQLKAAADVLNLRYQEVYDDSFLGEEEKVRQFIDFGCGLVLSHTFSPEEEQAMLQFMLSRLN